MKTKIRQVTFALCTLAVASFAQAQQFVGLGIGGTTLTSFGTNGVSSAPAPITGLTGGDSIIDIDFFSSGNGLLYGLGSSGTLYTINYSFGGLSAVATINNGPVYTPAVGGGATSIGTPTAIDFNPMADRLRVFSGTANYRITPGAGGILSDDGQLTYGDATVPNLVAAAYINNIDNPASTVLYSIDASLDMLVVHSGGPQFSMLTAQDLLQVGGVGAAIDFQAGMTGFDVLTVGGVNTAYLSNGNTFYIVNLNMGQVGGAAGDLTNAFTVTGLGAGITDFAVVIPEPSTYALLAVGLAFGFFVLRRQRARA